MNIERCVGRPFRSMAGTLLCAFVMAFVPSQTVFAQPPSMGSWTRDGEIPPDRPRAISPNLNAEVRLEPPLATGNRLPASATVTLHELSHHVPGRAVKEYERALKATKEGERENAMACLHKAIAADPQFVPAINNLGVKYLELNKVDLAIEQFSNAITVDPHSAPPHLNLAIAYLRRGLFADAEQAARRAVGLDRVDMYGRLVLGISSVMKGNFTTEAERSLQQAAQEFTVAKIWIAIGLVARGDIASARDHLKTYIAEGGNEASDVAINLLKEIESAGDGR